MKCGIINKDFEIDWYPVDMFESAAREVAMAFFPAAPDSLIPCFDPFELRARNQAKILASLRGEH